MSARPTAWADALYDKPFIDIDEWRDAPVRHRYVHGGFEGTDALFSCYFPRPEEYQGRFFHPLMPISGFENGAGGGMLNVMMGNSISFAVDSGAYLVESNLGRKNMFPGEDATIVGYRASAAVAEYSRDLATEMYGEHRPYGYVFGGSGGAFKTMSCVENALGVWDGAIPFVHATPMSLPNNFTAQAHALRVITDKLPSIIDAVDPGGSGDMYAGLNVEEREALAEITRMGFPPRAWFNHKRIAAGYTGVFSSLVDSILKWDAKYFDDFWSVPGYLGASPTASLSSARFQHKTTLTQVIGAKEAASLGLQLSMSAMYASSESESPAALRVDSLPEESLQGASLRFISGTAAGHVAYISGVVDGVLTIGFGEDHFESLRSIAPGDEVVIDNDVYLAVQTYHRHQVPPAGYHGFEQFCAGGQATYPQRPALLGPRYCLNGGGSIPNARFACKMIVLQSLVDEAAYPSQADWYRSQVAAELGPRIDEHYRLWFVDHAMHTSPHVADGDPRPVQTTRIVSYEGLLQQALRDLSQWVEQGLAPMPSTNYSLVDGQVLVAPSVHERGGIQPVVTLSVRGTDRVEVSVGEPVTFEALIEVPKGAGTVVKAEWDFEGAGDYPVVEPIGAVTGASNSVSLTRTYTFSEPGTYFPALRATSHRQGKLNTSLARVMNLDRVRVVVA